MLSSAHSHLVKTQCKAIHDWSQQTSLFAKGGFFNRVLKVCSGRLMEVPAECAVTVS